MAASTAASIFAPIASAFQDLLKYKIINSSFTGDKGLDTLLNTFLFSIVTVFMSVFSYEMLMIQWRIFKQKTLAGKLDPHSYKYYQKYITDNTNDFVYTTWQVMAPGGKHFSERLGRFFMTSCGWKLGKAQPTVLNLDTKTIGDALAGSSFDVMKKSIEKDEVIPIFVKGRGIIAIAKSEENVVIGYNDSEVFKEFVDMIFNIDIGAVEVPKNTKKVKTQMQIFNSSGTIAGHIYSDRTFDMFISRHKPEILNIVHNFMSVNAENGCAAFGGYGTYNLGVILHGRPGTGKTMFIKAVANQLMRNVKMIDMRQIRTRKQFIDIFNDWSKYIYVLDEFDCIEGVIRSRDMAAVKEADPLPGLKEEQMKTLQMIAKRPVIPKDQEKTDPLFMKLDEIKTQIASYENRLTLDSILTVLDGVEEMRGRCIIATTNHINRIDSALLREGRFDIKIELGPFNKTEIVELLTKMYLDIATEEDMELIRNAKYKEEFFTPVQIISIVTAHRELKKVVRILTGEDSFNNGTQQNGSETKTVEAKTAETNDPINTSDAKLETKPTEKKIPEVGEPGGEEVYVPVNDRVEKIRHKLEMSDSEDNESSDTEDISVVKTTTTTKQINVLTNRKKSQKAVDEAK